MMHSQAHLTPSPPTVPASEPTITATTDHVDEMARSHFDYNLQPLLVHGLDHYVTTAGEDERFFVH